MCAEGLEWDNNGTKEQSFKQKILIFSIWARVGAMKVVKKLLDSEWVLEINPLGVGDRLLWYMCVQKRGRSEKNDSYVLIFPTLTL